MNIYAKKMIEGSGVAAPEADEFVFLKFVRTCLQYCILYVIVQCSKLEAVGKPVLIIIIIILMNRFKNL